MTPQASRLLTCWSSSNSPAFSSPIDSTHNPAPHIGEAKRMTLLSGDEPAFLCPAVLHCRPDFHANLDQLSGQVARLRRVQASVHESLPGPRPGDKHFPGFE